LIRDLAALGGISHILSGIMSEKGSVTTLSARESQSPPAQKTAFENLQSLD
jgi:hypothetical protein